MEGKEGMMGSFIKRWWGFRWSVGYFMITATVKMANEIKDTA